MRRRSRRLRASLDALLLTSIPDIEMRVGDERMLALCLRRYHPSQEPRRDHAGLWVVHARADPRLDVHRLLPCVIAVRGAARQHRYCSPAIIAAVDPWTDRSRRTASASHPTSSSWCAARPPPPPSSTRPPPLDGDIQQVSEPSLGVSPCLRTQLAEHLVLSAGPERTRGLQGSSPFRCEFHRPDARVGVRSTLDHTIALQEVEAARQRCLVDGQRASSCFRFASPMRPMVASTRN